ncbi:MAG: YceD family protein [Bacteroidales bacterium]
MLDYQKYVIEIGGLVEGSNIFEFEIGKELFEFFEYEDANDVRIKVMVNALRNEHFIEFTLDFEGDIHVNCSRCLSDMMLHINKKTNLYVKLLESVTEGPLSLNDTNEWVIADSTNTIDLSHYIYEELRIEIPIAPVHKRKSDCNQEMLERLSKINRDSLNSDKGVDPRWEKLRELIKE